MRRTIRALSCAALLCACALMPGCTGEQAADPLASFGIGAELPRITPAPTAAPSATAAPALTPAPTERTDWAELPLEHSSSQQRPTRRPSAASRAAELDEQVHERQDAELDNTGVYQPNVASGGLACEWSDGQTDYVYFAGRDGQVYRAPISASLDFDPANAERVSTDSARAFTTTLNGDVAYIASGRLLVVLMGGAPSGREVLCEFEELSQLARWDDALLALGELDGEGGIYRLAGDGAPELIVPDAFSMQLDVVNRRILALDEDGLKAYSLTGEPLMTMIEGDVTALSYSGAELYYSVPGGIYRLDALGAVECVVESSAGWIGCHGPWLYYLDGEGMLHRAWLSGEDDEVISAGTAYAPTLLRDRVVYALTPDGGVSASAAY